MRWVQSTFAGVDTLDLEMFPTDCRLTGVKGIFGPLIAQYVFAHGLGAQRHVQLYREQQQKKQWQPLEFQSIQGLTVLVLGTGSIGQHLAGVARGFGMRTCGVNQNGTRASGFDEVWPVSQLQQAMGDAHWIVNTLPATVHTRSLLNDNTFAPCRGALFFNVGRGHAVEEDALLKALGDGKIAHAFLDVFTHEPLSSMHPFWTHPKVTVTPHE
ncbi:MAG: D-2-hydroxyacid dehydrogenase, partial [Limnobacter sp.]|nr:D-2-hydroxyacid dehydrogenase [Limnobacter sp.]